MAEETVLTAEDNTNAGGEEASETTTETTETTTESTSQDESTESGDDTSSSDETGEGSVPESYTAPEGVEVDADTVEQFNTFAKENDLKVSQDDFAKLIGFHNQQMEAATKHIEESINTEMQEGLDTLKGELGAEKFAAHVNGAKQVVAAFGDDSVRDFMNSTGMGNHPTLIKFLHNVSKSISEDHFVTGEQKQETVSVARKLFPNQN
jgi:hypothetical protein